MYFFNDRAFANGRNIFVASDLRTNFWMLEDPAHAVVDATLDLAQSSNLSTLEMLGHECAQAVKDRAEKKKNTGCAKYILTLMRHFLAASVAGALDAFGGFPSAIFYVFSLLR